MSMEPSFGQLTKMAIGGLNSLKLVAFKIKLIYSNRVVIFIYNTE